MEQMSNNEFEKLKNSDVEQANTKISEHEETKKQLAVQPPTTSAINQTRSKYEAVASSQSINRQEDVNQRDMIQARQDHYGQDSGNSKDCFAELDGSPQPTNESPVSNTANQIDSDLGREPTGSAQTQEQTDVIPERDNQSNQLDIDKDIAEEQHEVPSEVVSPSQDRELIVPSQEIQIDEILQKIHYVNYNNQIFQILSTDDQNTGVAGVVDAEQQSSPQSIQERPSYARSQSNIDESIRVNHILPQQNLLTIINFDQFGEKKINPMLGRMEHSNLFVRPTAQDDQDDDEEDYFRPTYFPKQKRSIGDIEQVLIAQPGSEEKKVVQEEEKVQKVKPKREEEKKASQNVPSQKLKANDDIQDGHSSGKRTPKIPQAQKAREERVFLGLMQDACSTKKKMIQDDKLEEEKKKRYGK